MVAGHLVIGSKRPAHRGLHAQDVEQLRGHVEPVRRPGGIDEGARGGAERREPAEAVFRPAQREVLRRREAAGLLLGGRPDQPHQLGRFGERQRAEEQGVHEPEHRGVQADATRQRQHRDPGEQRIAAQRPRGAAQVLPGAGQRPPVRHAGRGWRLPARLGQRAQPRREQIGALELGERERRRRLVVGAVRDQRLAAILEVLGQLVEDRCLARRRELQGGEAGPELGLPVTHDRPR